MAFQNLCQKIDVDGLRAKIGSLSSIPDMPQIKMPKSISTLTSRKIFRSSRENVNKTASPKHIQTNLAVQQLPPALFIDHTPQHISTISSLLHETDATKSSTYYRAHSIDYPTPRQFDRNVPLKPISPIRSIDIPTINTAQNHAASRNQTLVQRMRKGYKDLTEFRLKHIFAKKTVIRKDNIEVQHYVTSLNEERIHESQLHETKLQQERVENYRFRFKESRQQSGHSYSVSSTESITSDHKERDYRFVEEGGRTVVPRTTGNATTRFSKMRNPSRRMSEQVDNNVEDNEPEVRANIDPNPSTLWAIKDNQTFQTPTRLMKNKKKSPTSPPIILYGERVRSLTRYVRSSIDESGVDSEPEFPVPQRKPGERKARAPIIPQKPVAIIEKHVSPNKEEKTFSVIKNNIKRFHRSLKRTQPSIDDTEDEDGTHVPKTHTRTSKITARLRRFRSNNESLENVGKDTNRSPLSKSINNKIQTFKKSFTRRPHEVDNQTGDEATPEKTSRPGKFIKSLRQIRTRKKNNSNDELDANDKDNDERLGKVSNFEQKFERARKRTFKKVNEKMQQIKFFQKSHEIEAAESSDKNHSCYTDNENDDQIVTSQFPGDYTSRAMWTNKPINTASNDSDSEYEYPRVLIHQDNTDVFESTLMIAVTRSPMQSDSSSVKITELVPEQIKEIKTESINQTAELSNENLHLTPKHVMPLKGRRSSEGQLKTTENLATRNEQKSQRASSCDYTNNNLNGETWQVLNLTNDEKKPKNQSIDIFASILQKGGISTAFEDFDDVLKDEPVFRIQNEQTRSFDRDSSEDTDAPDDDNSSRITKILAASNQELSKIQQQLLNSSRENLFTNLNANHSDGIEDNDRPPSTAPSPPPLPERRACQLPHINNKSKLIETVPTMPKTQPPDLPTSTQVPPMPKTQPPDLPTSKQVPPKIPERTPSMSHISKPLVKTASLRLAYIEQVNPDDVGKVNKLISRFEQPKLQETTRPRVIPRNIFHSRSDNYSEDIESSESDSEEMLQPVTSPRQNNELVIINTVNYGFAFPTVIPKDSSDSADTAESKCMDLDCNSNASSIFNRASSDYGSPPEYSTSLMDSAETTPVPDRKQNLSLRSKRSIIRDEDLYLSFDSDEENSYYSISPSGSNRYIVDL